MEEIVPCGSGAFSLEEGRIAPKKHILHVNSYNLLGSSQYVWYHLFVSILCIFLIFGIVIFIVTVPSGSGTFSLDQGRIAPLPLPRHVVRGDYLECLAK